MILYICTAKTIGVQILALDDGEVAAGNRAIIDWARAHPDAAPVSA